MKLRESLTNIVDKNLLSEENFMEEDIYISNEFEYFKEAFDETNYKPLGICPNPPFSKCELPTT